MSTINNAIFADSDEEHDPDFIPEDHLVSSDEDAQKTEARTEPEPVDLEAERTAKEAARANLWAEFQSSVVATTGASSSTVPKQIKLVKIEKRYKFAGEEVSEIIEVPEESEDAKIWPLWKPVHGKMSAEDVTSNETSRDATSGASTPGVRETVPESIEILTRSSPSATANEAIPAPTATSETARRRPGPRKPKTTLTPIPSGKPKKLTTLEKSAMDWRSHVVQGDSVTETLPSAESLEDELERNRRSGGYLEKVAFLERVENRREELFDESRKRRRKG